MGDGATASWMKERWEVYDFLFCANGSDILLTAKEFFGADRVPSSNTKPDSADPKRGGYGLGSPLLTP